LGSSAFYAGGIAEQAVGAAAPWFILGIMLFSFAVRAVYVESCSMFTRGGVYRVVKEALGGTFAKLSVSALMFDYILTGPISGVSAGQYITGLMNELMTVANKQPLAAAGPDGRAPAATLPVQYELHLGAVCRRGHHLLLVAEHQGHRGVQRQGAAVMQITTVMVVILLVWGVYRCWCAARICRRAHPLSNLKFSDDALGFLKGTGCRSSASSAS
jgi:amino acid transporter